jgi:peptide-methionine (S)-S-oxide reductase
MDHLEKATFGAGCFWCVEAVFERQEGVTSVVSGYTGGNVRIRHIRAGLFRRYRPAEVAQITYDPAKVSYEQHLEIFWTAHDPTTLNRQGNDVGDQYRSAIFYHDEAQKAVAEKSKKAAQSHFKDKIVTEISPLTQFYPAENYHQDYYRNNADAPYCRFVIKPKLTPSEGLIVR